MPSLQKFTNQIKKEFLDSEIARNYQKITQLNWRIYTLIFFTISRIFSKISRKNQFKSTFSRISEFSTWRVCIDRLLSDFFIYFPLIESFFKSSSIQANLKNRWKQAATRQSSINVFSVTCPCYFIYNIFRHFRYLNRKND